jgi:hypothetical protein
MDYVPSFTVLLNQLLVHICGETVEKLFGEILSKKLSSKMLYINKLLIAARVLMV